MHNSQLECKHGVPKELDRLFSLDSYLIKWLSKKSGPSRICLKSWSWKFENKLVRRIPCWFYRYIKFKYLKVIINICLAKQQTVPESSMATGNAWYIVDDSTKKIHLDRSCPIRDHDHANIWLEVTWMEKNGTWNIIYEMHHRLGLKEKSADIYRSSVDLLYGYFITFLDNDWSNFLWLPCMP